MQISFGAKIPINTCNLYDNQAKKFIKAVVYEIDCKDKSDVDYFKNIQEPWLFRRQFIHSAAYNYFLFSQKHEISPNKIYSLEDKDGYVAGFCKTVSDKNTLNIEFIESSPSKKYKYAGQTMLASIAKQLLYTGKDLTVEIPAFEAKEFYSKVCKFDKEALAEGFILPQQKMKDFIERTERKTKGEMLQNK